MVRRLAVVTVALALAAAGAPAPKAEQPPSSVAPLELAQLQAQPPQRRGFLELLFGPRPSTQPNLPPPQPVQPLRPPAPSTGAPATPRAEAPPTVREKDPMAREILVVGDFVGSAAAAGLERAFADETRIKVVDHTNPLSGLVRDDFYDWATELPAFLEAETPDVVVVAVGGNDRQPFQGPGPSVAVRAPAWEAAYTARIDVVLDALQTYGRPFFWVELPPLRGSSAERDMAYINELFRPRVDARGGYFVDVWDGFADENGHYVRSGPSVEGQIRALRTNNDINFTAAGREKLAYYIESEIRRRIGIGTGEVDLVASLTRASRIEIGRDGVQRVVGPVLSLSDPPPGALPVLEGEREPIADRLVSGERLTPPLLAQPDAKSPQYRLVVEGRALPVVAGRADDPVWPRRDVAAPSAALAAANAPAGATVVGQAEPRP